MEYESSVGLGSILLVFGLLMAYFYGWVENIIILVGAWHSSFTPEIVLRIVGIPIGILGAIMGYIH